MEGGTIRHPGRWVLAVFSVLVCAGVAAADKSGVKPQVLSLPSGPGSIEGLGESFEPQLNSGTATYSIKLKVPPGRAGFGPSLTLSYNAGSGASPFGLGWRIPFPSVARQTDKGLPRYTDPGAPNGVDDDHDGSVDEPDEADRFVSDDGEELVDVGGGVFRPEIEGSFTKYERVGSGWVATLKDGTRMYLGTTSASRVEESASRIFKWYVDKFVDTNGNEVRFHWTKLDSTRQVYPSTITYNPADGSGMKVEFLYEARPDLVSDWRARFEVRTAFRCREIRMSAAGLLARAYRLAYAPVDELQNHSLLARVTQLGRDGTSSLPPAEFTYTPFAWNAATVKNIPTAPGVSLSSGTADLVDVDADGLPDLLETDPAVNANLHAWYQNLGRDPNTGEVRFLDFDPGTPVIDPIPMTPGGTNPTGKVLDSPDIQLADLDGDGRTDLLDKFGGGNVTDVYRLGADDRWSLSGPLTDAGFDLSDADVRLVDLDGDKRTDAIRTDDGDYFVWLALPEGRWSTVFNPPNPNPLVMKFSNPAVRLADMNGDRLQDLVFLENENCYWYPSKGLGEFGSQVIMDDPPSLVTDPATLQLADINGDGLSDAVWVNGGSVFWWINRGLDPATPSRGRFAAVHSTSGPVATGSTRFRQVDLNGNGSTDILWNTPDSLGPDRFALLDFAPGEQPYLMKTATNGIGKTTTIEYRSSVDDLVRDRNAVPPRPWPHKLPTPVPVLAAIEVTDGLDTNEYRTEMTYHDGYYDGVEKEFRGFGEAEKVEIGEGAQGAPSLRTAYVFDTGAVDEALKGKPLQVEAREGAPANGIFWRETASFESRVLAPGQNGDPRTVRLAVQIAKTRDVLEKGNGTPVRIMWEYDVDAFGNPILEREWGRVEDLDGSTVVGDSLVDKKAWDDERVTVRTFTGTAPYTAGPALWILGLPVTQEVRDEDGVVFSKQQNFYDDETFAGANLGSVVKGRLTMTRDWADPSVPGDFVASARKRYDAWGNPIRLYDPLWGTAPGHFREIEYDAAHHTFPTEEVIHTGNPDATWDPDPTLTMRATYDAGWGAMTSSVDFNGHSTSYGYDTFGRLTSIVKPLDDVNYPSVIYDYVLAHDLGAGKKINWVETRQREAHHLPGTVDERSFYDGLGRKLMTRHEGEDSTQVVVSDTQRFNQRGTAWKKYLPYFETGAGNLLDWRDPSYNTGFTEHVYDALGREVKMYQPVDPQTLVRVFGTTDYAPLEKTVRDENQTDAASVHFGCGMRYTEDALFDEDGKGRLRFVDEMVKLNDDGTPNPAVQTWTTRYKWDVLDNWLGYVDSQGNESFQFYDALKRKTFEDDLDRGWSWFAYDAAGNLVRSRDALGKEIARVYDGANRSQKEFYCTPAENTGNGLARAQRWTSPGGAPARPSDVEFHFDYPRGPFETGEAPFESGAEVIADAILGTGATDPGFDLTGDGLVNVADLVVAQRRGRGDRESPNGIVKQTVVATNTRGRVASVRDLSGGEDTSYDSRGRAEWTAKKIERSTPGNAVVFLTRWQYDAMDRPVRQTWADGTFVNFGYDGRGLVDTVPNVLSGAGYNPAGQIAATPLACGTVTTREYDHRLRLSRLRTVRTADAVNLQNLVYAYDNASNIVSITDERTNAELDQIGAELGISSAEARKFRDTNVYTYDSLYRLTGAENPAVWGDVDFRYDRIGNMRAKVGTLLDPDPKMDLGEMVFGGSALGTGNTAAWNRVGRGLLDPPGPHAFTASERGGDGGAGLNVTLDAAGRVTNNYGTVLGWDHLDRIRTATTPTSSSEYVYDYSHSRKRKTVTPVGGGATSETLYVDGTAEVRGATFTKYVTLGTDRVAVADGPGTAGQESQPTGFFLHDHLGSTNLGLGVAGVVTEQAAYQPYGRARLERRVGGGGGGVGLKYRYTGKERDEETELGYVERRYVDSALGHFLSTDPASSSSEFDPKRLSGLLSEPSGLSCYSLAGNSPVQFRDVDGYFKAFAEFTSKAAIGKYELYSVKFSGGYDFDAGTFYGSATQVATGFGVTAHTNGETLAGTQNIPIPLPKGGSIPGLGKVEFSAKGGGGSKGAWVEVRLKLTIKGVANGMDLKLQGTVKMKKEGLDRLGRGDVGALFDSSTEYSLAGGIGKDLDLGPFAVEGVNFNAETLVGGTAKGNEIKDMLGWFQSQTSGGRNLSADEVDHNLNHNSSRK